MNDNERPEPAHVAAQRLADIIDELYARDTEPSRDELAAAQYRARTLSERIVQQVSQTERALDAPHATEQVRVRDGRSYFALLNGARSLVELWDLVDGLSNADNDDAALRLDQARRPAADAAAWLKSAARENGELLLEPGKHEARPCLDSPPRGAAWDSAQDVARAGVFLLARAVVGLPIDGGLDALITDRDVLYRQVIALRGVPGDLLLRGSTAPGTAVMDRIQLALDALQRAEALLRDAQAVDRSADARNAFLLEALSAIVGARLDLVSVRDLAGPEHEPALAAAGRAATE